MTSDDQKMIAEWEAENRRALVPALEFLRKQFMNQAIGVLPWDRDGSQYRAALDAYRAIEWLLKPIEQEVLKLHKEPYKRMPEPQASDERSAGDGE
jgi:hypothetical protein